MTEAQNQENYSAVQMQFRKGTNSSSAQDVLNINISESPKPLMSLLDLGFRINQALKLASSLNKPNMSCSHVHLKTLNAFNHFVTVTLEDPGIPKTNKEIIRNNIV